MEIEPFTLELHPVGDVADFHGVVVPEQNLLPEHLNAVLEVPRGQKDVLTDHLVLALRHVVLQECLPRLPHSLATFRHIHCHLLLAIVVHFIVYDPSLLLHHAGEVLAPSLVATAEREEKLEGTWVKMVHK